MKSFKIVYIKTMKDEVVIRAKTEAEALKKFCEQKPNVRIIDVQCGRHLELAVWG